MSATTGRESLRALLEPSRWPALAATLRPWLPAQRWFAGKARAVTGLEVADAALLDGDAPVLDVLVDVAFAEGPSERYHVPLADDPGAPAAAQIADGGPVDAIVSAAAARTLADACLNAGEWATSAGMVVVGSATGGDVTLDLSSTRPLGIEQSNSSVVLGDRHILKVFRKLEEGENPEVEVTRALTAVSYPGVPAQHGSLLLRGGSAVTSLAVLSDFVRGAREGWALATAEVARLSASPVHCALADPWLLDRLGALGGELAGLHLALRRAFGTLAATSDDLRGRVSDARNQAERVLKTAATTAADTTAPVLGRREALLERLGELADPRAAGPLTRTHGDLHLGQVLLDADDRWQVLDFEGEPARPLAERRGFAPPLRDLAGLLRSLDYAAATGSGGALDAVGEPAAAWRDDVRRRLLDGYLGAAAGLLPPQPAGVRAQLDAFELDKAVYELGYELANRPGWVAIPVGGIVRLLDSG